MAKKLDPSEVAVIVDDNGYVRAHFVGPFAKGDAKEHLAQFKRLKMYHGATVVTGEEAKKALKNGRL